MPAEEALRPNSTMEALDAGSTTLAALEEAARVARDVLRDGGHTTGSVTADRLLLAIARSHDGVTTGALTRAFGVPPSTVSSAVNGLVEQNLVERRPNPSDRRRQLAGATAAGRLRAERVAARWRYVDDRLLGGLSLYERDELARLLRRAAAALVG
ncbi:MAG: MarR family winged helix-turn-helix transcriptional regulator [Candidatus Longimicrobiales bacterium M2_2A_002]